MTSSAGVGVYPIYRDGSPRSTASRDTIFTLPVLIEHLSFRLSELPSGFAGQGGVHVGTLCARVLQADSKQSTERPKSAALLSDVAVNSQPRQFERRWHRKCNRAVPDERLSFRGKQAARCNANRSRASIHRTDEFIIGNRQMTCFGFSVFHFIVGG